MYSKHPDFITPSLPETLHIDPYIELIRSIPETEKADIFQQLETSTVIDQAAVLSQQLAVNEPIDLNNIQEKRTLFLAALKGLEQKKISPAQLATLHILDSAICTLYANPLSFMTYKYRKDDTMTTSIFFNTLGNSTGSLPTTVKKIKYNIIPIPRENMTVSNLPWRMQNPLMQRFFNFTESEWNNFCSELRNAPVSEQYFSVLVAPEKGCWSNIVFEIQKVLKVMRVIDWLVDTKNGLYTENIMLVPSFTMFQAAINAKAKTLDRKPLRLLATYGYIDEAHYTVLKSSGIIAVALYLPESNSHFRYHTYLGQYRVTIDGHPKETAFAGAIHDLYHAMRELSMSEAVAAARMRLALIAKNHPKNHFNQNLRPIHVILVDGELIFSYPAVLDTMFEPHYRAPQAEPFGNIFYTSTISDALHPDLKRAFIKDMVENQKLWVDQFNITRADLRPEDQVIYDELAPPVNYTDKAIKTGLALMRFGLWALESYNAAGGSMGNTYPSRP